MFTIEYVQASLTLHMKKRLILTVDSTLIEIVTPLSHCIIEKFMETLKLVTDCAEELSLLFIN